MKLFLQNIGQISGDALNHVKVDEDAYWVLTRTGSVVSVVRDRCAHMGSPLRGTRDGLVCPSHGWTYGFDGKNRRPGNGNLESLPFSVEGGALFVNVPDRRELLPPSGTKLAGTERLDLLAHASFFLSAGDVRLLFDPWLVGNAYWGSWRHYPRAVIDKSRIQGTNHIIISHPHPDHFDLPTMELLPRGAAVYFPPFVSRIIPRELERLGFSRLVELVSEQPVSLGSGVSFAFMRPTSLWEDSSVLVRVHDWIWLNQNDAGAPLRDEILPSSVDLLSSSFDIGASGYPQMWGVASKDQERILRSARVQILKSIAQRCERTQAKFFAPFASWWRHGRPEHADLASAMRHNTLSDVERELSSVSTRLVRTEPGTSLNLKTMELRNIEQSASGESLDVLVKELGRSDHEVSTAMETGDEELSFGLQKKLAELAQSPFASGVEHVLFSVEVDGGKLRAKAEFGQSVNEETIQISARISRQTALLYAFGDLTVTWNHLDIGWWVRWEREPDVYPARFMRLLQLGSLENDFEAGALIRPEGGNFLEAPVATLVEKSPKIVARILDRAGLPCVGCSVMPSETLGEALVLHGVAPQQRERLLQDLDTIFRTGQHSSSSGRP